MKIVRNPSHLPEPPTYSHGIEVPSGGRTLYIAGQIAVDGQGNTPEGIVAQTRLAFENLLGVLKAAGMGYEDIVKTTVFLTQPEDYPEFAKTRSSILGSVKPASTLVVVKQLVAPKFIVEVEAIAVKA